MRAGIFLFFDEDGIVDRYVDYFLKELKTVVDYLVVVVNGKLSVEGRQKFSVLADDFFVRENKGFDVWAYHDALDYIGWDELKQYDEMVFTNNTVFGPLYPFKDVFSRMDGEDCDWWGLQRRYEDRKMSTFLGKKLIHGYMPEFSLSNFWVIRKTLLHSYEFKKYWANIPEINSYAETCIYHEPVFTKTMCDAGYTFATVDGDTQRGLCPSPTIMAVHQQITELGVPIVRRRVFSNSYENVSFNSKGEQPSKVLAHIDKNTDYDADLIWEYILRTQHQYDIKNNLNLTRILPTEYRAVRADRSGMKAAAIMHVYYSDLIPVCLNCLKAFPKDTDIYLISNSDDRLEELKEAAQTMLSEYKVSFLQSENRGRDVSSLLIAAKHVVCSGDYELVCFMHDKKVPQISFAQMGQSYAEHCYQNIAATETYVRNVIDLFEDNPRMGLAVPPAPNHGIYYFNMGGDWGHKNNFVLAKQLLDELSVSVKLDIKKPAVAPYGTMFWFRCEALLPLFEKDWKYEDFPEEPTGVNDGTIMHAVERVYSLVAQGRGYYPMTIISDKRAELELTQLTYENRENIAVLREIPGMRGVARGYELRAKARALLKELQNTKVSAAAKSAPAKSAPAKPVSAVTIPVKRPKWKQLIRNCTPIGIWNLLLRFKCLVFRQVYVNQEDTSGGTFKKVVKWCMPRGLWNQLRKEKCRALGWDYVEE